MTFKSPRFASNARLRSAQQNNPPLRQGERGEAVAILQEALIDLAYPMPLSTAYGSRRADGVYGNETLRSVCAFQDDCGLQRDGIAGRETLDRLDDIFASKDEISYVAALWTIIYAGQRLLRAPGAKNLIGGDYYAALMMQIEQLKVALARHGLVANPSRLTGPDPARTFQFASFNKEANAGLAPLIMFFALMAAVATGVAITAQGQLPKPKLPELPRRPPPEVVELVSKMAAMATTVAISIVNKTIAQIKQCKEEHPDRVDACAALLTALDDATAELRKALEKGKSPSASKFPGLQGKIDTLQEKFNNAVDAAAKCLGCTNLNK